MQRKLRELGYDDEYANLNLDEMRERRKRYSGYGGDVLGEKGLERYMPRAPPLIDQHPEYYADSMPYGAPMTGDSLESEQAYDQSVDQVDAFKNPDNKRRTKVPQTYSYMRTHPTDKEVREFRQDYSPQFQDALRDTTLGRRAAQLEE